MHDTALLQALKLKGRAPVEALASALGRGEGDVQAAVDALVADGLAEETKMGFRLTERGREALEELLAAERAGVDRGALARLYEEFCAVNDEFKALVTSWQMKSETELNDHTDAAYDRKVLDGLDDLHGRFRPIAERAAALVPRLSTYVPRFDDAIARVRAGEVEYVARPLIDSYHTVWFELHEELIQGAGLNRSEEGAF